MMLRTLPAGPTAEDWKRRGCAYLGKALYQAEDPDERRRLPAVIAVG